MSSQSYGFYISQWKTNKCKILQLRKSVLVEEFGAQNTLIQAIDDPESFHVIAYDGDSNAIGAGSMSKEGVIYHVVVLNQWRRRTVGKAIVLYLINIAKIKNLPCAMVMAPVSIMGFYQSMDFDKTDVIEVRQGISHQKLVRTINMPTELVH